MAQTKRTFNEMLRGLEKTHSETLMRRARKANRIAKTVRGKNRRNAYEVKSRALSFLVRHMPERTDIRKDIVLTDFVVVELKGTNRGLHFPAARIAAN
jgi:RNA:NAD 2'-phosphotransferase (TPT1/KptA family)